MMNQMTNPMTNPMMPRNGDADADQEVLFGFYERFLPTWGQELRKKYKGKKEEEYTPFFHFDICAKAGLDLLNYDWHDDKKALKDVKDPRCDMYYLRY